MVDGQGTRAPVGAAAVACLSCRRLKMRCVGADSPPCMRCKKSGRKCEVVFSNRNAKRNAEPTNLAPRTTAANREGVSVPLSLPEQTDRPLTILPSQNPESVGIPMTAWHMNFAMFDEDDDILPPPTVTNTEIPSTNFPSTYVASPFDTITSELAGGPDEERRSMNECALSNEDVLEANLPQIVYFVQFFRTKIIHNVPFLRTYELDDIDAFVRRRKLLSYAIALVSSSFAPGYESFRAILLKETWETVHTHSSNHTSLSQDELWTLLQTISLLVLYPCPSKNNDAGLPDYGGGSLPLFPSLKTFAEHIGLRLQLHRSPDQLASVQSKNLSTGEIEGLTNRCLMWLFLYTISCHWSILAGAPPTIPLDRSIRLGCEMLRPKKEDPAIWRIVCEVEMFLIWNKFPLLREWWCTPGSGDPKQYKSEIAQFDAETYNWSRRWTRQTDFSSQELTPAYFNNTYVDFLLRHVQFHVSAYAARSASGEHSWFGTVTQRSFDGGLINSALQKASHKNNFLSQVSPIALATARYVPPVAYAMSTYSALFILTACEAVQQAVPNVDRYLASVGQLAEFMRAIATPSNVSPKLFAERITMRLNRVRVNLAASQSQTSESNLAPSTHNAIDPDKSNEQVVMQTLIEEGFDYTNFVVEPFEDIDMFGVDYQWTYP